MTETESKTSQDADAIRERALERAARIATAYLDAGAISGETEATVPFRLGVAFQAAGDGLHEEADAVAERRARGWQTLSKEYRGVAARLVGIAQDLAELATSERSRPVPPPEDEPTPDEVADEPEPVVGSEEVKAYLAGVTSTPPDLSPETTPAPPPEEPTEETVMSTPHLGYDLAFADPEPVARQFKREPFPGALEHRRTYAQLMAPVDAAGVPDHWSWSQLTGSEDCGVQHRLARLEGVPQQPQWANIGGTTFHAVTEAYDRAAHAAGGADLLAEIHPELIRQRWEEFFAHEIARVAEETGIEMGAEGQNYRASKGGAENYTWWIVEGTAMLTRYVGLRRKLDAAARQAGTLPVALTLPGASAPETASGLAAPAMVPVIEYPYRRYLATPSGTVAIEGVIDRAYWCADGSIMIKDLKSGSSSGDTGQLGEYAWALVHLLTGGGQGDLSSAVPKIRACFYDARKGIFTDAIEPLVEHPHEEYVFRYGAAQAKRQVGLYQPRRSHFCKSCSVAHACPIGGQ